MRVIKFNFIIAAFCLLVFILVFTLTGCVGIPGSRNTKPSSAQTPEKSETTAVYYDFEDVLIPKELSIVEAKTMVISTPDFASGVLTLKGRVERNSLFSFFVNNMMKDNWIIESSIKSPGVTILVFKKATRCAVITFENDKFNNIVVQIGVAPILGSAPKILDSE
ncbi:MAG: hypothetical protein K8R67_05880 [Desulfobacteraceae bacterium]|nr:hypothetical protein [Desulfobacteraceae bacterium]